MKISKRLSRIADMVTDGSVLADIGCDHGLLPIYLVQQGIVHKAYACDINPGPLSRAQEAIDKAGLSGTISTLLSDGLQKLPADVDCIVIAGMGFETIRGILEASMERLYTCKEIIVQSNTDVKELRRWIDQQQFHLLKDEVVLDGHFYQILKFNTEKGEPLTEKELLFGIQQDSPDFLKYCEFELKKTKKVLQQLSLQHDNYKEFLYYKEKIEEVLKEKMEHSE